MILQFAALGGMRPGVAAKLLPSNMATLAKDVDLADGTIHPLRGNSLISALTKTGTINSLYRLDSLWAHWTEVVSVARIPIENNEYDRIIFTGADRPRMTDRLKAIEGGGTDYPEVTYYAGLPAPSSILEGSVTQTSVEGLQLQWDIAGTIGDTVGNKIARVYVYTFVTEWGEEGPPSDPSQIIYAGDDDQVTLTNFASMPSGPYQISAVRIYRSESSSTYRFVKEVEMPLTSTVDITTTLGSSILSTLWDAPKTSMTHVVAMANGMLAGIDGNTVRFSEPYQGHAWPDDYEYHLEDDGNGLAAAGNYLFITTEGNPYYAVGTIPSLMSFNKLETEQTIASERSLVDIGDGAMYAAADGLVLVTAGGADLITAGVISEEYWRSMNPSSMHGYLYKDQYIGFFVSPTLGEGGFIYDPAKQALSMLSTYCSAAYSDLDEGNLYMAIGGSVYLFDDDDEDRITGQWTSKEVEMRPHTFGAARVDADAYPVTFKLYGDGVLKHTQTVASSEPFRLPGGYSARTWQIDVTGTEIIEGVFVASTMSEMQ